MMKKCKCEFKCQIEDTHDEVMKVMKCKKCFLAETDPMFTKTAEAFAI